VYAGGAKDLLTDSAKLSLGEVKELGTGAFQEGKALFGSANAGIDKLSRIGAQRAAPKQLKKDAKKLERQRARLQIQNQQSLAIAEAARTNMELEERNRILEEALLMANQP